MTDQTLFAASATLLVVDDNSANLRLLADMLSSRGYTVQTALDGPTALALVNDIHPDVILLDIAMPNMNGYEVCRRLKADEATRSIPVVFISALTETDDIVKGFDVGGADYITKPFKFREVLARAENQITMTRQRLEIEALRQQDRQHFETLDRMKTEFIRMATHDLRNPLNVILGYLKLMEPVKVEEDDRELVAEGRRAIQDSVEKMRQMVTDLLDLSQLETGLKLTPVPVALHGTIDKSLNSLQVVAAQHNLTLDLDLTPDDVTINADPTYITRVIDNLMWNAIKYTPSGGRITTRTRTDGNRAIIEISDTGIGISEADLPRLFEPFFRVKGEQYTSIEGSGLGLSIVKAIVEQHSGEIRVTSQLGQGSTFTVSLPRGIPQPAGALAAAPSERTPTPG